MKDIIAAHLAIARPALPWMPPSATMHPNSGTACAASTSCVVCAWSRLVVLSHSALASLPSAAIVIRHGCVSPCFCSCIPLAPAQWTRPRLRSAADPRSHTAASWEQHRAETMRPHQSDFLLVFFGHFRHLKSEGARSRERHPPRGGPSSTSEAWRTNS